MVLEAIAAVDGAVVFRLERDLGGRPPHRADRVKHLTVVAAGGLAACAAVLAANGFVLESLLRVKLLLADRKDEILTAILAYQCLVLEHFRFFPFSVDENMISECRLTWFLPPHSPTGSVATRRYASHYCLSRNACFDMLRLDLLLDRTMLTGLCPLTWIVLPATGIDFQPQTRYADTKISIVHPIVKLQCIFLYKCPNKSND